MNTFFLPRFAADTCKLLFFADKFNNNFDHNDTQFQKHTPLAQVTSSTSKAS